MSTLSQEQIDRYSKILSHSQLLNGVEENALKTFLKAGTILFIKASTTLLEIEKKVDGLHIILEGSAKVQKGSTILTTLGRGSFFGEISLFGVSFGATASIITHDPSTVLVVNKTALDSWAKEFPDAERTFLRKLCTELCRRLYSTSDKMS